MRNSLFQSLNRAWRQRTRHGLLAAIERDSARAASFWIRMGADVLARAPSPYENEWGMPLVDLSHPIQHGWSLVHLAAARNARRVLAVLASKGAALEEQSRCGATPLQVAAWHGHDEAMDALAAGGADTTRWAAPGSGECFRDAKGEQAAACWSAWRARRDGAMLGQHMPAGADGTARRL